MKGELESNVSRRSVLKTIGGAAAAATGAGAVTGTTGAVETGGVTAGETYKLLNLATSNALDIVGAGTQNGDDAQQWDYLDGASQQWTVESTGDGYYKLVNANSGKVLDVEGVSQDNGARLHQWDDVDGQNQQFDITETAAGVYKLTARHSGKVVEVPLGESSNGSRVQQWGDGGGANQRWVLVPVGDSTEYNVTLANDDRYEYDGKGYVEVDVTNEQSSAVALNPTVVEVSSGTVYNEPQPDIVIPANTTERITVVFDDYDSAGDINMSVGDESLVLQQVPYLAFPSTSA